MTRRLPPLNALRAFEAAARHLSFTRAAQELHVTPAAISHQIKALEEHLGQALFRRLNRMLLLTDAGQLLLPSLSEGFDRLAEAVDRLERTRGRGTLVVSIAPSFASKWLVPRLERFAAACPEVDVQVSANMMPVDLHRDAVDVAIRFGFGDYPGVEVVKLFDEAVAPLCAPWLLDGDPPLSRPEDLRHHTLLHDDSARIDATAPDWRMWLKASGVEDVDPSRGPHFSFADHAMQAAIEGAGVVLGRLALAERDLAAGRLVKPFALSLPIGPSYYILATEGGLRRPEVVAFRDWMLAETRRPDSAAES